MSQGFDINIANAKQNPRTARKNKVVADLMEIQQSLVKHFEDVEDPRVERTKKHLLVKFPLGKICTISLPDIEQPSRPGASQGDCSDQI